MNVGAAAPNIGGKCRISEIGPNIWLNIKNANPKNAPSNNLTIKVEDLVDPMLKGTASSINTISDNG